MYYIIAKGEQMSSQKFHTFQVRKSLDPDDGETPIEVRGRSRREAWDKLRYLLEDRKWRNDNGFEW